VGKPFVAYSQRTVDAGDGRPLHSESGYLRGLGGGLLELVLAQPSGIVELAEGEIVGGTIRLKTVRVDRTATAKDVVAVERDIIVDGDVLRYEVRMAAVGQPLTHHLSAELHRTA
jgi:nitrobindin-like protein